MAIIITQKVLDKIKNKHGVSEGEVEQCFANIEVGQLFLKDIREQHNTDPPTLWFISETDYGIRLKIVFMKIDGDIHLKSAFRPNAEEDRIYRKYGRIAI